MTEIGPFGIPIATPEDCAEMEREGHWRACTRVVDVDPHLGSGELRARRIIVGCLFCEQACFFDPHSSYPKGPKIICLRCLVEKKHEQAERGEA